jgi:elongation factor 1-gamma
LDAPEGPVFESNAIARYVARQGKLYGANNYEAAVIDQWIDFASNEIELPSAAWLYPILDIVPENREATNKAKGDIRKALDILNHHLETRTFLVGERISLADIVVSMSLYRLYQLGCSTLSFDNCPFIINSNFSRFWTPDSVRAGGTSTGGS